MNNDGRKRIDAIISDVEKTAEARAEIDALIEQLNEKISDYKETFADIATAIEEMRDEEQEKFDNLSEGLQQSEKGQTFEATISALDTAYDQANNASDIEEFEFEFDTDELIGELDNAKYAG
jgi:methyl-accepting chemotaxis protein